MIPLTKQRNHAVCETIPRKKNFRCLGSSHNASGYADAALSVLNKIDDMDFNTKSDHLFRSFPLH